MELIKIERYKETLQLVLEQQEKIEMLQIENNHYLILINYKKVFFRFYRKSIIKWRYKSVVAVPLFNTTKEDFTKKEYYSAKEMNIYGIFKTYTNTNKYYSYNFRNTIYYKKTKKNKRTNQMISSFTIVLEFL